MTSLDVILCKGNKSSFRSFARSLALRAHCRATRSKARLVSKSTILQVTESAFFPRIKNLHTKKTRKGSQSIKKVGGRKMFCTRFASGSLFVSPCPPECNFQSETKKEPDLRLMHQARGQVGRMLVKCHLYAETVPKQESLSYHF